MRRDGRAEPQAPVSVTNIPGLNPKSFRSLYDMKTYILLIRPPLNLAIPLILLGKSRLITLPRLTSITRTLHHNTTFTHTLILSIFSYLQITRQYSSPKWYRNRKWVTISPLSTLKRDSKVLKMRMDI